MHGNMKVAVLAGIGKIVIEERPIPVPKDNEVLVKIKHVGICGSDLHYYENGRIGDFIVSNPLILGHESSGIIVEKGKNVTNVDIGDTVALEPGHTCGKCEYCKSGKYNLCPDVIFMATPPVDGAFAEYVAFPADMAFKLPDDMDTMEGALIEPLAVAFHAVKQGDAHIGQTAAILGTGCIGLVTLMTLKAIGISEIYTTEIVPKRMKKAQELGAYKSFDDNATDIVEEIMNQTNGKGVDLVFETAGSSVTARQTVELVKRGGTIVMVGLASDNSIPFDFNKLITKEASIKTVFRYRNLYPAAISAVAAGIIPIKEIVTDVFKFQDIVSAIKYSSENRVNSVKGVIEL